MNSNKHKYCSFSEEEEFFPIYSKSWWLDATCGKENWDVALVEKGGKIVASLPYFKSKMFLFSKIGSPPLTRYLGPYLKYPDKQKYVTRLSFEKEVTTKLIQQIPRSGFFMQYMQPDFTNWLPFYWQGFNATPYYTYILKDLTDLDSIFNNFRSNIKTDIRKAGKTIRVEDSNDLGKFYAINKKSFERQNKVIPYSFNYLSKIDEACLMNDCRKIFLASDGQNNYHAAVYFIWDNRSAYYILSGGDPKYRNSGATSLLIWEAIQYSSKVTRMFDFEGSMIEPVERFFRAFGAIQTPIFKIYKFNSFLLKSVSPFLKGY